VSWVVGCAVGMPAAGVEAIIGVDWPAALDGESKGSSEPESVGGSGPPGPPGSPWGLWMESNGFEIGAAFGVVSGLVVLVP